MNHILIIGRVSKNGPKLTYAASGTPTCSFVVEVDELGKGGEVFITYLPVEISGKYAEAASAEVEPGDEVQLSGKLKYKSAVDPKTQTKTSKLIISTWGIQQRRPGSLQDETSVRAEGDPPSDEADRRAEPKVRKPRYPKWKPTPAHPN